LVARPSELNLHSHLPSLRLGPGALGRSSRCSPAGRHARTGETQVTEEGLKLLFDWSGPPTSRVIRARPGWLAGRLHGPSLRWWVVGGRDHPTEPTTSGSSIRTASSPEASPRRLSGPQTARPEGSGLGSRQHVHEADWCWWCLLTAAPGEAHGLCLRTCFLRLPARVAVDDGGGVLSAKRRRTMRRCHPPSSPHGHLFLAFPTKSSKSSLSRRKPSSNPGGVDSTANRGAPSP
jgi:hypothetical protein